MEGGSAREPGLGRRAPEPAKLDSSNPCSEPSRGGFENWQLPASDSQGSLLPLCPWLRERRKEISKVISRFPEQTEEPGIRGRGGPEGGGRRWLATASALLSEIDPWKNVVCRWWPVPDAQSSQKGPQRTWELWLERAGTGTQLPATPPPTHPRRLPPPGLARLGAHQEAGTGRGSCALQQAGSLQRQKGGRGEGIR